MDAAGVERDAVGERVREMETDLARSKSELRNAVEILDEHAGKLLDVRKKVLADETIDRNVVKIWEGERAMWTSRAKTAFAFVDAFGDLRGACATPWDARAAVLHGACSQFEVDEDPEKRLLVEGLWPALGASARGSRDLVVANAARGKLDDDDAAYLMFGRRVEWFGEKEQDACVECHSALGAAIYFSSRVFEIELEQVGLREAAAM